MKTITLTKEILKEILLLEMFDTGTAGDEVGGMTLQGKKNLCAKDKLRQWDDATGHCADKPLQEEETEFGADQLFDYIEEFGGGSPQLAAETLRRLTAAIEEVVNER